MISALQSLQPGGGFTANDKFALTTALISLGFLALGWVFRQIFKALTSWAEKLDSKIEKIDTRQDRIETEMARIAAFQEGVRYAAGEITAARKRGQPYAHYSQTPGVQQG